MNYIGRFAPSPTGDLHMGSLIAALASFLDARHYHGQWLLRIENIDPPREVAGSSDRIISSLQAHGLYWDGDILYQNQRIAAYQDAINKLIDSHQAYYCHCSRKQLTEYQGIYPGFCRDKNLNAEDAALRVKVPPLSIGFNDRIQGFYSQSLSQEVGDFVVQRRDKLFAYQLAVVVDDAEQAVTHIVRGADLLESTPRQCYLQQLLQLPQPSYAHIPLLCDSQGEKLSKQLQSPALSPANAITNLQFALQFLQQPTPPEAYMNGCKDLLQWAIAHWQIKRIPTVQSRVDWLI